MRIRLERTPQDETLGYDWIEVESLCIRRGTKDGLPDAWIGCDVTTNRTVHRGDHHSHMAWEDIENAIRSGDYKLVEFEW